LSLLSSRLNQSMDRFTVDALLFLSVLRNPLFSEFPPPIHLHLSTFAPHSSPPSPFPPPPAAAAAACSLPVFLVHSKTPSSLQLPSKKRSPSAAASPDGDEEEGGRRTAPETPERPEPSPRKTWVRKGKKRKRVYAWFRLVGGGDWD
jgi:hypothetical protein